MGQIQSTPINEAVFLLDKLAPQKLTMLRNQFPLLREELEAGIMAGPAEDAAEREKAHLEEKAKIVATALDQASHSAEQAMTVVSQGIKRARGRRLASQIIVLLGSTSLLGALALNGKVAEVISAVLTLAAAVGNLLAEYYEKLLNPQAGNVYDAFQKLGEGAYKARTLKSEIELAVKYEDQTDLNGLVGKGNALCEELNGWLIQIVNQYSARLAVAGNQAEAPVLLEGQAVKPR